MSCFDPQILWDAVSCLLLKQHLMFYVDQMDMQFAEFELCQILVSEVELGSGFMVVVFSSVLWYLRWTMV